ncbi:MAG: TonB-dependent receptor, partial [Acidobacteria bacterium]
MPGAVVENELISGVPLSARNWDDLLGLVPGVQGDRYTEQGGGTASGRTGAVNVHGVRSLQNNFVLDGVDNNSFSENVQELTTQIVRPSVDAIQEFKIATNPYSAENGRSPGSLVTVTTKSGANAFHGLVYEYLRNKVFDANDFFTNRVGRPRPKHVQNQYGGQIGGPV